MTRLLELPYREQEPEPAQDRTGERGMLARRADGKHEEEDRQQHAETGECWPRADPDQLGVWSVVLDREHEADASQQAAVDLQIPTVEVAAPPHDSARLAERGLDRRELLLWRLPRSLAGRRERARPRRPQPELSPAAPGCEAVLQAPDEPRQRLQQMEQGSDGEEARADRPPSPLAREGGGGCAEQRLHDGGGDGAAEQRQNEQQRLPRGAERSEPPKCRDDEIPLGHEREGAEHARGRLIQRLERRGAPRAVIDARAPAEPATRRAAVDPPAPRGVPRAVVFLGPLRREERLGSTVAFLLLPERAHRVSPMVPHDRSWTEAELPTRLLQLPAHVHIVASDAELRIEAADRLQRRFPEGHVAARDVLRLPVGEDDVRRAAGY